MWQAAMLSFLYGRFCAGFHQDGKGAESLAQSNQDIRCVRKTYVLLIGVLFVGFNLLFDILQTISDPRLRKESH